MINIEEIQNRINKVEGVYHSLKSQETTLKNDIENIKEEIDVYNKASLFLSISWILLFLMK